MPIDPNKFKKVVTKHFDNLTQEEFLKTLQKSSPYLFDNSSGVKHDIHLSIHLSNRHEGISSKILAKFIYLAKKITRKFTKIDANETNSNRP
jgi:hypothetical protein